MTLSLNEVQMLAQKAARGGGAYPAQAAHFGRAVVCHLAQNRAVADVIDALNALPGGPIQTLPMTHADHPGELAQSYREAEILPSLERVACPDDVLTLMHTLAHLTYVPASAASRAAGAGAGLTDND